MFKFSLLFLFLCLCINSSGGVLPSLPPPPGNQVCIGVSSVLNDFVIAEIDSNDFTINGTDTLILKANGGIFMYDGGESVIFTNNADVTATILSLSDSTQIVIKITESSNANGTVINELQITGVYFKASNSECQINFGLGSTLGINGMSPGISTLVNVNGNQRPDVSNSNHSFCSGDKSISINLQNNVANGIASFEWSATDNANITGETTSLSSSNYIIDELINLSLIPDSVIYNVTPTSFSGGCVGDPFTITIIVNPLPDILFTNNTPTISSGDTTDIFFSSSVVGTSFIFSAAPPPEITATDLSVGDTIVEKLTNTGGPAKVVVFTITAINSPCVSDTITTVTVNGFPSITVSDSLALVDLYNATDGDNWSRRNGWLNDAPGLWEGVTVADTRVTKIKLDSNNLKGVLPASIDSLTALDTLYLNYNQLQGAVPVLADMTDLVEVDISGNEFTSIPNLSAMAFDTLNISDNYFTFEDLEPNNATPGIYYASQKQFLGGDTLKLNAGDTFSKTFSVGGTANSYQWNKNGTPIAGANTDTYTIPAVSIADAGIYDLTVTNSIASGAILTSEPIFLTLSLVSNADSLALLDIYNLTGGPGWTNSSNWGTGTVDTWYGVTVNAGRVSKLKLDNNNLTGALPAQVGNLSALTHLDLSINNISGLPASLFGLTALTHLNLSTCQVTGTIPNAIGKLISIDTLDLSGNQFSGAIPDTLTNLPALTYLALNSNLLTGAVPNFSSVPGSLRLFLQGNDLTALPNVSSGNISELDISNNKFTFEDIEPNISIPTITYTPQKRVPTGGVQNISTGLPFNASFTVGGTANTYQWLKNESPIGGATSSAYSKAAVSTADAGVYKLSVTNSIAPLLTLYSEDITLNVLTSATDSLALVSLYNATGGTGWLNKNNWLTGNLNTWYGVTVTSGRVTAVDLTNNKLTGTIPSSIGNLSALTALKIGSNVDDGKSTNPNRNAITGLIPIEIGNLTNLAQLNLSSNDLTGTLPASFSNLILLQELWLSGNKLSLGILPATILAMTNLQYLKLSFCGVTDAIPSQIQNLTALKFLLLNDNQITGIPPELVNLTQLQYLYLNNNLLSALPTLTPLTLLTDVRVHGNKLTFEDLEPNAGVGAIMYSPQDSVGVKNNIFIQAGVAHTFTSSVGGTANQYTWKKDGTVITGATAATFVIPSPDFADEGVYTFEVTNTTATGLALQGRAVKIQVSSLKRDSLALVQLYNATKGGSWTNKAGWLSGKLSTWNGVTISGNRVTGLNLVNNNLDGAMPVEVNEMFSLKTVDLSNNKITKLPALPALTQLTSMNVSGNKLDFASLEANLGMLGIMTYSNQAAIGIVKRDSVQTGSPYTLTVTTAGTNNNYQWKRNNVSVSGATLSTYTIGALNRSTMGDYSCDINNSTVPGLILKSALQTVLATTDLSGKLLNLASVPITKGKVMLFRVTKDNGYDTIRTVTVDNSGAYIFKRIVLDNYQILGFADTLTTVRALPTYYKSTPFWEEADTLFVQGAMNNLDILSQFKPVNVPVGKVTISGFVQQEEGVGGGRVKAPKRISGAGVSVRRVENTGRGKAIVLTLVAYVFTNEEGEFEIPNLPVANYRLNIQYPGYPMDETSDINFPITEDSPTKYHVEATVTKDKITVKQEAITGIRNVETYSVQAYPNPSNEFITVQFAAPSLSRTIQMTDNTGKKIGKMDAPGTQVSLDVRTVLRGMYLLTVTDKNQVVRTLRVVVK